MSEIDWDKVEKDNMPKFKNYAPVGDHKTKVSGVELKKTDKNEGIRFILADNDEYKFPKWGAMSWIKTKRDSFRQHHMKEIFVVLGFTEEQARKAVQQCEDKDNLGEAYLTMFEKALPKSKEVDVVVLPQENNPEYTTWDFASDKVRMGNKKKTEEKKEDIFEDAVELKSEDVLDMPF